jgi:eukaryotic-like serine/threonine-protein kinase
LGDFFIDRYEVTNREYKRFVDAGGYGDRQYWTEPFVLNGRALSWEDGMALLIDQTARPGPATWQVGAYPDGQDDFPVSGVSWYEAAAYARFAGKSLPSVHHWRHAYGADLVAYMAPLSNLERDGPTPVGRGARGPFGTYDMVGNVREWCYNAAGDQRFLLGGGWNDPDYLALNLSYRQPPFDRSPTNGIRLVRYLDEGLALERALAPAPPRPTPDLRRAGPLSADVVEIYRRMYAYDPLELDARIESADTARHWVRQRISFNAAYGGERMLMYLYLPLRASVPLQTVVYYPGSFALNFTSIEQWRTIHLDFIIQSGRAVAFPVLWSTFERGGGTFTTTLDASNAYRDAVIRWTRDVMRTVDYLTTRDDLDASRLVYYGFSWGGRAAPIVLTMEPRLKAAVLYVAGIGPARAQPEADELTYLRNVSVPVLMLNGRLDDVFPLETSAKPMFDLLGTPAEHKRHVISEGGHFVPRPQLIRELLDWLDRYLGPVGG